MTEEILREWYNKILAHAKANYERGGWDNFVECVGFDDFKDTANRPVRGMPNTPRFASYNDAFNEYKEWCELKNEMNEEIRGWAF